MRRYREGEHGDPVFERLLGIEMKREQYAQGGRSATPWSSTPTRPPWRGCGTRPSAMPSLPEIEEPRLWLARTV